MLHKTAVSTLISMVIFKTFYFSNLTLKGYICDEKKYGVFRFRSTAWDARAKMNLPVGLKGDDGFLNNLNMKWEWTWLPDGSLDTLTAPLKAIRMDERTGMKTFFNAIIAAYTGWTDSRNDPRKAVCMANGEPMNCAILEATAGAMEQEAVAFKWEKGDVLMIDNRLVLHARRPFTGPRRILASIATA